MRLEGKVAWITGGGNGIGRATAQKFASEGASLVLADVDEGALAAIVKQIVDDGGQAVAVVGSIADREDVQRMADAALDNYGHLDILVNNAGINRDGLAVKVKDGEVGMMGDDKWDPVLDVNLKGTFLCSQAAAVPMIDKKGGRIVNTSSVAALGNIGQANYAASKAGVIGLTKTLALEWARHNITVNCVAPGATRTRMTEGIPEKIMEGLIQRIPARRLGEPTEIAAAHAFLASDEAAYITGQVLFVDGGISVGA
jgi:NAD(P)-dependent dehydrogenase (short-subunit alcohol dehydrogenase family)